VTLDVFTTKRYNILSNLWTFQGSLRSNRFKGNPVAIVKVTDINLSQEQKQRIAKEFNFSETVFLHPATGDGNPQVDIFTPVNEMEFAGHPIIGAGHFLFRQVLAGSTSPASSLTVMTKAGPVPISYDEANKVIAAEVPHNIHIHKQGATLAHILPVQASLKNASDIEGVPETSPVVSVVKGVTYALVDLSKRPDIFANIGPGGSPNLDLDEGWAPSFTGVMYHRHIGSRTEKDLVVWDLRVRMVAIDLEDPACGSGGSSLGAYLALSNAHKGQKHRYCIDQGSEMGRDSLVIVDVILDEERKTVSTIKLAGHAAFVAEGKIFVE
jgi:PhzF family phenazine biosynthesis protein